MLDAEPDAVLKMPEDSPWPFILTIAIGAVFTAMLVQSWWATAGASRRLPSAWVLALAEATAFAGREGWPWLI